MFAAGQREMQQIDQYTIETIGLPGVVLMENAGAKVVEEILESMPCPNPKIVILAGGGDNGGDGFVIARRLVDLGMAPFLCVMADRTRIKGDAKVHFDAYVKRGLPVSYFNERDLQALERRLGEADIIVDAMLGTGVKGVLREPFHTVIPLVNKYADKSCIISVDIPSGVNSDTGKAEGGAIKAAKTVTFVFPKKGFFLQDGPKYVGEWKAVDISVPSSVAEDLNLKMATVITPDLAAQALPKRTPYGHKGTFGHALVIGGSRQYAGAPVFSAQAALNSGAGLTTLAIPENLYPILAAQHPEILFAPLQEKEGHFAQEAIEELSSRLKAFNSIVVGPGMSRFRRGEEWMKQLLSALHAQPIVLDADALYLMRDHLGEAQAYPGEVIMTPHPGEMAVLLQTSVQEVEKHRLEIAEAFAKEHGVYLLLKGHRSLIASPDGEVYINPYGHDALGKGGSGDVLTGLIASFLAQGAAPLESVIAASYLHAKAGEEQAKRLSRYGVLPQDIIHGVREELRKMEKQL